MSVTHRLPVSTENADETQVLFFVMHACICDGLLKGLGKAVGQVDEDEYIEISKVGCSAPNPERSY